MFLKDVIRKELMKAMSHGNDTLLRNLMDAMQKTTSPNVEFIRAVIQALYSQTFGELILPLQHREFDSKFKLYMSNILQSLS